MTSRATIVNRQFIPGPDCVACGYKEVNVLHEQDPENAPEGIEYYRPFLDKLHPFVPVAVPVLVTEDALRWALQQTHDRFPHVGLLDDLDPEWLAYTLVARLREGER